MTCDRKIGPFNCCSVVQGDCLELMKQLPDRCVDAVITDPPYGMQRGPWDEKDFKVLLAPRLKESARVLADGGWMFVFTSTGEVLPVGNLIPLEYRRLLWMYKPADMTFPWRGWLLKSEAILVFSKGEPLPLADRDGLYEHDVYTCKRIGMEGVDGHPTVKPMAVVRDLVSRIAGITLDPYLGSGTTAVAAKKLGRHFLGFEISEEYCRISRERLARIEAQPNLFEQKIVQKVLDF